MFIVDRLRLIESIAKNTDLLVVSSDNCASNLVFSNSVATLTYTPGEASSPDSVTIRCGPFPNPSDDPSQTLTLSCGEDLGPDLQIRAITAVASLFSTEELF